MRGRTLAALLGLAVLAAGAAGRARADEAAAQAGARRKPQLKDEEREPLPPDIDLIDLPTAAVLDYGALEAKTRFGHAGNNLTSLGFGVFQRLQFGASLSVDQLVGTASPIILNRPELQLRWRFYDGSRYVPAAAIGFDGQGYFHDRGLKTYMEKERGFYIVGSQEVGVPGLMIHPGINVSDFDTDAVFAFLGAAYNVQNKFELIAEWDNIRHFGDSRLNLGARFFLSSFLSLTVALREIGQGGNFPNGEPRRIERLAALRYVGNF